MTRPKEAEDRIIGHSSQWIWSCVRWYWWGRSQHSTNYKQGGSSVTSRLHAGASASYKSENWVNSDGCWSWQKHPHSRHQACTSCPQSTTEVISTAPSNISDIEYKFAAMDLLINMRLHKICQCKIMDEYFGNDELCKLRLTLLYQSLLMWTFQQRLDGWVMLWSVQPSSVMTVLWHL